MTSKFALTLACMALTCAVGSVLPAAADTTSGGAMLGFTAAGADRERDLEQRFDAQLSASEMRG